MDIDVRTLEVTKALVERLAQEKEQGQLDREAAERIILEAMDDLLLEVVQFVTDAVREAVEPR